MTVKLPSGGGLIRLTGMLALTLLLLPASRAEAKRLPGWKPQLRTWLSYGARWTSPQKAGISLTAMRAWESDEAWVRGWFLQAEPGLSGGTLGVGYGVLEPSDRSWLPPEFAASVKIAVLRTWGTPTHLPSGTTLVGPELDVTFARVKAGVGWLAKVDGPDYASAGVFTWGLGVGF